MGSSSGFYVRLERDREPMLRALLKPHHALLFEEGLPFAQVSNEAEPDGELMSTISQVLDTDVIWLEFESSADTFGYLHWSGGELVRALGNGLTHERVWESVDGEPEPWEHWRTPPKVGAFAPIAAQDAAISAADHWGFAGTGAEPRAATPAKPRRAARKPIAKKRGTKGPSTRRRSR